MWNVDDVDVCFHLLCLCARFPNIGQSCYMNSSLQSLLTLEDFVRDISCQERVWGSVSAAQVMRYGKPHLHNTSSSTHLKNKIK